MLSLLPSIRNTDQKVVLSFFDYTSNLVRPWADAGFLCYCFDWLHPRGYYKKAENIYCLNYDIPNMLFADVDPLYERVAFCAFFPDCTYLTNTANRHNEKRQFSQIIKAANDFYFCHKTAEKIGAPYFIENPPGKMNTFWRKPDYIFQPWEYGDNYTKRTCLWTGGGFIMPPPTHPRPDNLDRDRIHMMGQTKRRAINRAATPKGFSYAVFQANHIHV